MLPTVRQQYRNAIVNVMNENNRCYLQSDKSSIVVERDDEIKHSVSGKCFGTAYSRTRDGSIDMALDYFQLKKEIITKVM
jgi:hypothetical protein